MPSRQSERRPERDPTSKEGVLEVKIPMPVEAKPQAQKITIG